MSSHARSVMVRITASTDRHERKAIAVLAKPRRASWAGVIRLLLSAAQQGLLERGEQRRTVERFAEQVVVRSQARGAFAGEVAASGDEEDRQLRAQLFDSVTELEAV